MKQVACRSSMFLILRDCILNVCFWLTRSVNSGRSAVCSFRLTDIKSVFSGNYKVLNRDTLQWSARVQEKVANPGEVNGYLWKLIYSKVSMNQRVYVHTRCLHVQKLITYSQLWETLILRCKSFTIICRLLPRHYCRLVLPAFSLLPTSALGTKFTLSQLA